MSKPDFDKVARGLAVEVRTAIEDEGRISPIIRAALEDAYNAALEDACNETTNSHVKAAVRALKIVKEG